ncbi:MAG: hypothetical protein ACMXYG_05985 [Candidatus Woesearchaeota archaeon]
MPDNNFNNLNEIIEDVIDEVVENPNEQDPVEKLEKQKNEIFFYTWWGFEASDADEAFRKLNNSGKYPREIGNVDQVTSREQQTKQPGEIEGNVKFGGFVHGHFLGMQGITLLNHPFEDEFQEIPESILQQYPVIGLGAARAKQHQINEIYKAAKKSPRLKDIFRGSFKKILDVDKFFDKLGVIHDEDLRWKWTRWDVGGKSKEKFTIKGRLVTKETITDCPNPIQYDNTHALDWAKDVYAGNDGSRTPLSIGLNGHIIKLKISNSEKHMQQKTLPDVTTFTIADKDGYFEFKDIPEGSKIESIESLVLKDSGYKKAKLEFFSPFVQIADFSKEAHNNIILSKEINEGDNNSKVVLIESTTIKVHNSSLDNPFGSVPKIMNVISNNISNEDSNFHIKKGIGKKHYHVFFVSYYNTLGFDNPKILTKHELNNRLKITNLSISFKYENKSIQKLVYDDHFCHNFYSNPKVIISPIFNVNKHDNPMMCFLRVFVAVLDKEMDNNELDAINNLIIQHADNPTDTIKTQLKNQGVLDFNFNPFILWRNN